MPKPEVNARNGLGSKCLPAKRWSPRSHVHDLSLRVPMFRGFVSDAAADLVRRHHVVCSAYPELFGREPCSTAGTKSVYSRP